MEHQKLLTASTTDMLRVHARVRGYLTEIDGDCSGCAFPNWHRRSRPPAHRRELTLDRLTEFFQNSASLNGSESGGGQFPARFFAPSGPAIAESTQRGKGKEEPMNPLIQLKKSTPLFLIPLVLACFALSPRAQAVTPAPDGGYPGFNTAEGFNALLALPVANSIRLSALPRSSPTPPAASTRP